MDLKKLQIPPRKLRTVLDVIAILAVSLAAEAGHFAWRQGRAVEPCGDSIQYVDGAEALLSADRTPHFEFRKPGYSLLLAGLWLTCGNMGWAAVAFNHMLLALLPVAAYCLGRLLLSPLAGRLAAILLIAQLQGEHYASTIMTEPAYATVLTFAIILTCVGLKARRGTRAWMAAGGLFGVAWLLRSVAIVPILAAVIVLAWTPRMQRRRALMALFSIGLPVVAAVVMECGLNAANGGRFRPCTGTIGQTMLMRARYLQGLPFEETQSTLQCLALLPERDLATAYQANKLDAWVAVYRAIHEHNIDAWDVDDLMKRTGIEILAAHPAAYLKTSALISWRHLLRQRGGVSVSSVSASERSAILVHTDAIAEHDSQRNWYAYWALPHQSLDASFGLASRLYETTRVRAPFGQSAVWSSLRHWTMTPAVVDFFGMLRDVASLWPGFALLLCGVLGLDRRVCLFLGLAYVLEAVLIGAVGATNIANERFQFVWIATDTTLVGALLASIWTALMTRLRWPHGLRVEPKSDSLAVDNPSLPASVSHSAEPDPLGLRTTP